MKETMRAFLVGEYRPGEDRDRVILPPLTVATLPL